MALEDLDTTALWGALAATHRRDDVVDWLGNRRPTGTFRALRAVRWQMVDVSAVAT